MYIICCELWNTWKRMTYERSQISSDHSQGAQFSNCWTCNGKLYPPPFWSKTEKRWKISQKYSLWVLIHHFWAIIVVKILLMSTHWFLLSAHRGLAFLIVRHWMRIPFSFIWCCSLSNNAIENITKKCSLWALINVLWAIKYAFWAIRGSFMSDHRDQNSSCERSHMASERS